MMDMKLSERMLDQTHGATLGQIESWAVDVELLELRIEALEAELATLRIDSAGWLKVGEIMEDLLSKGLFPGIGYDEGRWEAWAFRNEPIEGQLGSHVKTAQPTPIEAMNKLNDLVEEALRADELTQEQRIQQIAERLCQEAGKPPSMAELFIPEASKLFVHEVTEKLR